MDDLENQVDLIKQTFDDNQQTVNTRFSEINQTISDMKQDMSDMKQDMSDMKHDLTDMKHTISGLVQNVDILSNKLGQLLSKLSSAPPSQLVPAFDPTSSAKQSEVPENLPVLPPTPVISESHPCVWNGTNSKVKAAAYRSPSPLTTDRW